MEKEGRDLAVPFASTFRAINPSAGTVFTCTDSRNALPEGQYLN
jgi:hypothetical protein